MAETGIDPLTIIEEDINVADFSVCDPNARWVTAFSCETGTTANWGCMTVDNGQVPQVGQFVVGVSTITGTAPVVIGTTAYPGQPAFWLILAVQPQNPNILGNTDRPTANVGGATACGYECSGLVGGCYWTGLPTASYSTWSACTNAVTTGACAAPPTHFCTDFSCMEIVYGATPFTVLQSTEMDEVTVLNIIQSRTTGGQYPYSDLGGIWDGLTLTQMFSVPGTPAVGGTSIYSPLASSLDDCITCCGGVNQPFDSGGIANQYYAISATTHTGFAAYLAALGLPSSGPTSGSFIPYLFTQGIDSCGEIWCSPWPQCSYI